jgi:hypothetical protein
MIYNGWLLRTTLVICCFSLLVSSCTLKSPISQQLSPFPEEGVCRVAVLPLKNSSNYRDGDLLFYRVFTAELASRHDFELVQEGDIRAAYRQVKVNPHTDRLKFEQMRIIGDYLDVQVMVVGFITEMGEKVKQGKNVPYITVTFELIRADTGRTILTSHHRRNGLDYHTVMHFGVISNLTQLSHLISQEILKDLASEGFVAKCID